MTLPVTVATELPVSGMARHLLRRYTEYTWAYRSAVERNVAASRSAAVRTAYDVYYAVGVAYAVVLGTSAVRLLSLTESAALDAGPVPAEHVSDAAWFERATAALTARIL